MNLEDRIVKALESQQKAKEYQQKWHAEHYREEKVKRAIRMQDPEYRKRRSEVHKAWCAEHPRVPLRLDRKLPAPQGTESTEVIAERRREWTRQWRQNKRDKGIKYSKDQRVRRYNISPERLRDLVFFEQGGRCANPSCTRFPVHIDHDHACCPTPYSIKGATQTCGKCFRGMLCSECNLTLGAMERVYNDGRLEGLLQYGHMLNKLRSDKSKASW